MGQKSDMKYEETFKRLEKLVNDLERETDLDAKIKKFEEALPLADLLQKKLRDDKKKVELLIKKHGGELTAVPLNEDEDDSAPA